MMSTKLGLGAAGLPASHRSSSRSRNSGGLFISLRRAKAEGKGLCAHGGPFSSVSRTFSLPVHVSDEAARLRRAKHRILSRLCLFPTQTVLSAWAATPPRPRPGPEHGICSDRPPRPQPRSLPSRRLRAQLRAAYRGPGDTPLPGRPRFPSDFLSELGWQHRKQRRPSKGKEHGVQSLGRPGCWLGGRTQQLQTGPRPAGVAATRARAQRSASHHPPSARGGVSAPEQSAGMAENRFPRQQDRGRTPHPIVPSALLIIANRCQHPELLGAWI